MLDTQRKIKQAMMGGFFTFGFIDGRSCVIFVPCLQTTVPALTVFIRDANA